MCFHGSDGCKRAAPAFRRGRQALEPLVFVLLRTALSRLRIPFEEISSRVALHQHRVDGAAGKARFAQFDRDVRFARFGCFHPSRSSLEVAAADAVGRSLIALLLDWCEYDLRAVERREDESAREAAVFLSCEICNRSPPERLVARTAPGMWRTVRPRLTRFASPTSTRLVSLALFDGVA